MGQISENTKKFVELIKANPDLPIIPIVSEGFQTDGTVGEFGYSKATSVVEVRLDDGVWFFTKEEQDELELMLSEEMMAEDETLTEEEANAKAHEKAEALDWKETVVVYIDDRDPDAANGGGGK